MFAVLDYSSNVCYHNTDLKYIVFIASGKHNI